MKRVISKMFIALLGFSILAGVSARDQMDSELKALKRQWVAAVQEQQQGQSADARVLASLVHKANTLAERYPDQLEPRIWESVIVASYAEATGNAYPSETLTELVSRLRAQKAADQATSPKT